MTGPSQLGIVTQPADLTAAWRGCILTIGNFDGVHLGHQAILSVCATRAGGSAPVVAMTFDPHPIAVLAPDRAPEPLTSPRQRAELLCAAGATGVFLQTVDHAFLGLTAEAFVRDIVVARLMPRLIVEGPDFGFGRGRHGNISLLRDLGRVLGFDVEVVEPLRLPPDAEFAPALISSSGIREMLRAGTVECAARCLGRPYSVLGHVRRGEALGRTLGYPTINLGAVRQMVPGDGVYAGWATIRGQRFAAAISIGRRETFDGTARVVEAFLLDAAGDWYEQDVELEFLARLRDQHRFENAPALGEQIARDVESVRRALGQPAR